MRLIGKVVSGVGTLCYWVFGLWGFILSLAIVDKAVGFWGVVVGFVFFPATLAAAPWYALVHWGAWFPLLITYGGFALALILKIIGGSTPPIAHVQTNRDFNFSVIPSGCDS